ncbi:MAG: hypothetical protein ACRC8G_11700, partial [Plesiomonas shigelloides]
LMTQRYGWRTGNAVPVRLRIKLCVEIKRMNILNPNRPSTQFRCRIVGGRLSYEQIVAAQIQCGNNQPRRGLVVGRAAVDAAWGEFYGSGRAHG